MLDNNSILEILKEEMNKCRQEFQDILVRQDQLRGQYTGLYNLYLKLTDEKKSENDSSKSDTVKKVNTDDKKEEGLLKANKAKATELVKEAKAKGKITTYEEFSKSELGKETAIKDIKDVVSKEKLAELHKAGEVTLSDEESEALRKVIEEVKDDKENSSTKNSVDLKDVPEYLKDEYKA